MNGDGMFQGPHDRCADGNQTSANRQGKPDRSRSGFGYSIGLVEGKTCIQFHVPRRRDSSCMCDGRKMDPAPMNGIYGTPVQGKSSRRWLKCSRQTGDRRPCIPHSKRGRNVGILYGVTVASQTFPNALARAFKTNQYESWVAE